MININQFKNKKILITGSTSGLGASCAKYFSKFGSEILVCGTNIKKIKNQLDNTKNIFFDKDLSLSKNVDELISTVIEKKFYDIVIHCMGGGFSLREPLINSKNIEKLFRINLSSSVEINSKIIKKVLNKKKSHSIIHIGSTASTSAIASVGYNTVKAALAAYVRSIGREYAYSNIKINAILPGAFYAQNNSWERLVKKNKKVVKKFILENQPRKKIGNDFEILPTIALLASEENSMMRGSCLPIDGGESRNYDGIFY
tara:strand:+ start:975 stop:1748 length:774 start_codon:yes stop_codon:yes gene_type:complete